MGSRDLAPELHLPQGVPNQLAHVAERLRSNNEKILQQWERCVREAIPESKHRDKEAIRNTLHVLLEKIAHTLSKASPKQTAELEQELSVAREHGEQRSTFENYSLKQVIHEYQLLRKTILDVLEEKSPLAREDRDVVLDAISLSERIAAAEFYERQLKAQRELEARTRERDEAERQRNQSRGEVSELVDQRGKRESFVSTLAHDLLTPVAAVRMSVDLLRRHRMKPEALEFHSVKALANLLRLEDMIRDLLDANRIKAGQKLAIEITAFDLRDEIQKTLASLAVVHGDRFEFVPGERIEGYWDQKGIRRIVENLCSNAVKYGDPVATIRVSLSALRPEQRVELRVQNQGPLISHEDQKTLFDQFRRGPLTGDRTVRSWGIGLSLVRGMAEAHGGGVLVRSTPEEGTVFTVSLPLDSRSRVAA